LWPRPKALGDEIRRFEHPVGNVSGEGMRFTSKFGDEMIIDHISYALRTVARGFLI
jgi:signal peptidase I